MEAIGEFDHADSEGFLRVLPGQRPGAGGERAGRTMSGLIH